MSNFDREAARARLDEQDVRYVHGDEDDLIDALEGCVRPAPAQTIDRDSLVRRLEQYAEECGVGEDDPTPGAASDILALLLPVDSVTLTRDEAATAASFIHSARGSSFTGDLQYIRDLVRKLEAAQ